MPDQIQLRGGTAADNDAFTGVSREVTVDTTNKTLRVHDGVTSGGSKLAAFDEWGRLQVADPQDDQDVTSKSYVDGAIADSLPVTPWDDELIYDSSYLDLNSTNTITTVREVTDGAGFIDIVFMGNQSGSSGATMWMTLIVDGVTMLDDVIFGKWPNNSSGGAGSFGTIRYHESFRVAMRTDLSRVYMLVVDRHFPLEA